MSHDFTNFLPFKKKQHVKQFSWCKFHLVSEISRMYFRINSLLLPNFPQNWRIMNGFMSPTSSVAPLWNSSLQLSKFSYFLRMQFQANSTNSSVSSSPLQSGTWNRIHRRDVWFGFAGEFLASCGRCHHSLRIFWSLWNGFWGLSHCCLRSLCICDVFTLLRFVELITLIVWPFL